MSEIIKVPCDCDNGFIVWNEPTPDGDREHKETCPDCKGWGFITLIIKEQNEGDGYPNFIKSEVIDDK